MLLIAAGAQVVALSPLQAASAKREITDSGITAAVEGGLAFEKGVFPSGVDVSTSQGIVTLSGSVNNLLAKERAVKMAESIRGVRQCPAPTQTPARISRRRCGWIPPLNPIGWRFPSKMPWPR
jgi:hypothetical protein